MAAMIYGILAVGFVLGLVGANTVLHKNGYEGVVVAISEQIPEDPNIIHNLKLMFEEGSQVLFEATRRRAYFQEVTIVIPASWTPREEYMRTAGSGWLTSADIRVDVAHPLHADDPYTLQLGGCGDPGAYIHLSPGYATGMYSEDFRHTYGPPGKVLVHEWAHFRWGVFDEYGEHGTHVPPFYIGEDLQLHVTGCTADIKGWLRTEEGELCHADESGMPDRHCYFFPSDDNKANGSFMNLYFLDSVRMFCDDEDVPHNALAPNVHNLQCNGRSVWQVITQHKDFKNNTNPPRQKRETSLDLKPKFQVIQEAATEKPRFVLLLDLSGSMDQFMKQLYQAVVRFVRDLVPTGSLLAVVSFANRSRQDLPFTVVGEDREDIVRKLPDTYTVGGYTAIGGALEFILQMVERTGTKSEGLMVVLITDGEETIHPKVETKLSAIKDKGIVINTVSFGPNATDCLEHWAEVTGGRAYYHSTGSKGSLSSLDALLFDSISKADGEQSDQLLQVYRTTHKIGRRPAGSEVGHVVLDSSLGHETRLTFTEDIAPNNPFSIGVRLRSPDGQEYGPESGPGIYHVDVAAHTITFTILEAMPGQWTYNISNKFSYFPDEVMVAVTSHPSRKARQAPVRVKTWMTASKITFPDPAPVYAYVSQGYSNVLDANVTAVVVPPTEDGPISFPLLDNGVGADILAGDGIYSGYFTQFSANGRYSLSATVSTSNRTTKLQAVNPGPQKGMRGRRVHPAVSVARRKTLPLPTEALPEPESKFPPSDLRPRETGGGEEGGGGKSGWPDDLPREKMEPFTRFTSGGIFKVHNFQPGDQQPPGRVTDLSVSYVDLYEYSVSLTWTSPGDDLYTGTASSLELRYHESQRISLHFHKGHEVTASHLTSGDLTPRPAGEPHSITLKIYGVTVESLEGRPVFFGLRALDEKGNQGNLSNIATAFFPLKKYARNLKEEQKMDAISGLVVLVLLAIIILLIVVFIASVKFLHVRRHRKSREQQLVDGGHRLYL